MSVAPQTISCELKYSNNLSNYRSQLSVLGDAIVWNTIILSGEPQITIFLNM